MRARAAIFVTVLAIFLNLFAPLTHSVALPSHDATMLEICTGNGVEYVSADELLNEQLPAEEDCPLCAECPVCWQVSSAKPYLNEAGNTEYFEAGLFLRFTRGDVQLESLESFLWPESRAPPTVTEFES